jgi:hypothetical protein
MANKADTGLGCLMSMFMSQSKGKLKERAIIGKANVEVSEP